MLEHTYSLIDRSTNLEQNQINIVGIYYCNLLLIMYIEVAKVNMLDTYLAFSTDSFTHLEQKYKLLKSSTDITK